MNVDVGRVPEIRGDPELARVRADPGQRSLGRLLHHVAELSGEREVMGPLHARGLDEEQIAAGRRPREPGHHAGHPRPLLQLLVLEARDAKIRRHGIRCDRRRRGIALGPAAGDLPADAADLTLEISHAGLPGVAPGEETHGLGCERHVGAVGQPVLAGLARRQVLERDAYLLLLRVTGQVDHFHPVPQGRRHRVDDVGGRDEQDSRQVEGDVEIVIPERRVLLRVEDLEERGRGIAAEIGAELVDLVQHEDRILGARPPQSLRDLARQGADVRPPMATDLRLVAHATQRDAMELAAEGSSDRPAE